MAPTISWKHQWTLNPQGNLFMNDNNHYGYKMLSKMGWSKGKGLGKNEDGNVENIKVKVKMNTKGVGYNEILQVNGHHDDFNALLSSLNADHSTPNGSTSDRKNTNDQVSLEKHSKTFRNRLHYQKFIRGKDVSNYSKEDMRSIFGEKLNHDDNNFPVEENQRNKSSDVTSTYSETSTYQSNLTITDYFAQKRQEKADKLSNINKEPLSDQNIEEDQSEGTYPSTSNSKKRKKLSKDHHISKKSKCHSAISFVKGILKINKTSDKTEKTCKSVSFNENISIRLIEGRNVNDEEENSQENDDVYHPSDVNGSGIIHFAGISDKLQKSLKKMMQRERKKAAKKARKRQKLSSASENASQLLVESTLDINPSQDINIDIEQPIKKRAGNSSNRDVEEMPEFEEKLVKLLKKAHKKLKKKNKCLKQQNKGYEDHGSGMHQVEELSIPDTPLKTSKKKKRKGRALKHQREAIGKSNNIGEQNHIQQEIQPETFILCKTENYLLREQGAQSSESVDSEQPEVKKPYVPKKNKDKYLKHQREASGESNNIEEQNHIRQEIDVQPQTSILCATENSLLHEQEAQSSESVDSEQPRVRKPYVPKKNSWTTSQKLALKMSHYKDMFEKICQHSILSTSNLNEIKGYGNW